MEKNLAIQIIEAALELVILPLVVWAIKEIATTIRAKTKDAKIHKYINICEEVVSSSVKMVSQTYVDALKEDNFFTKDAQKEAFDRAMNTAKEMLTDEAKEVLTEAFGDLNTYLTAKIEAKVADTKKELF